MMKIIDTCWRKVSSYLKALMTFNNLSIAAGRKILDHFFCVVPMGIVILFCVMAALFYVWKLFHPFDSNK